MKFSWIYIAFYWIPLFLTKFYLYVLKKKVKTYYFVKNEHEEMNIKKLSILKDIQFGVGQTGVNQVSDLEKNEGWF